MVHAECTHGIYNPNHKAAFPKMVGSHFLAPKDKTTKTKGKEPAPCCQLKKRDLSM